MDSSTSAGDELKSGYFAFYTFVSVKTYLFFSAFILFCFGVFGQSNIPDKKFRKLPEIVQSNRDSIKSVNVFIKGNGAFREKPLRNKGTQQKHIEYLPNLLPKTYEIYDRMGKIVKEKYDYNYVNDEELIVSYEAKNGVLYSWLIKNSVVQECSYSKLHKGRIGSRWVFEYTGDTLMTSCIKYSEDTLVEYEIEESWSPNNRKLSRTYSDGGRFSELTRFLYSFSDSTLIINQLNDNTTNETIPMADIGSVDISMKEDLKIRSSNEVYTYGENGYLERLEIYNHKGAA